MLANTITARKTWRFDVAKNMGVLSSTLRWPNVCSSTVWSIDFASMCAPFWNHLWSTFELFRNHKSGKARWGNRQIKTHCRRTLHPDWWLADPTDLSLFHWFHDGKVANLVGRCGHAIIWMRPSGARDRMQFCSWPPIQFHPQPSTFSVVSSQCDADLNKICVALEAEEIYELMLRGRALQARLQAYGKLRRKARRGHQVCDLLTGESNWLAINLLLNLTSSQNNVRV